MDYKLASGGGFGDGPPAATPDPKTAPDPDWITDIKKYNLSVIKCLKTQDKENTQPTDFYSTCEGDWNDAKAEWQVSTAEINNYSTTVDAEFDF